MRTQNKITVLDDADPASSAAEFTRLLADSGMGQHEVAQIPSGTNLNNLRQTRSYHQPYTANTSAALNYPTTSAGLLEVFDHLNFSYQRYTTYQGASNGNARLYVRGRYNSTWSAWKQLGLTTV